MLRGGPHGAPDPLQMSQPDPPPRVPVGAHRVRVHVHQPHQQTARKKSKELSAPAWLSTAFRCKWVVECFLLESIGVRRHTGGPLSPRDIVDELAKKGTTCGEYGSGMPGTRWNAARADADLWHLWEVGEAWATEARMRIHIHWDEQGDTNLDLHKRQDESHLTWIVPPGNEPSSVACLRAPQVSEITRILRTINTKDAFGSLNLLPSQSISNETLSARYAATVRTLRRHKDEKRSDWKRHNQAVKRMNQALKQLQPKRKRDALCTQITETGRHTTRTKEGCPIDVSGLKTFIESEAAQAPRRDQQGRDTGKTLGETAKDLLQRLSETQSTDISSIDQTFITGSARPGLLVKPARSPHTRRGCQWEGGVVHFRGRVY